MWPRNPIIYEINTRLWLRELSEKHGRRITLGTVPDEETDVFSKLGFDALWLMGVWTPSEASMRVAREHPGLRDEFLRALPDLTEEDIVSSPYAVRDYVVSPALDGDAGMADFRKKIRRKNLRLLVDFVPNHTATDHGWVREDPDLYVRGRAEDLARDPHTFFQVHANEGPAVLAHGRDPYFPAWTDTAQLNYCNPRTRERMIDMLLRIANLADGVRCDMAMLILKEVQSRIWGEERLLMRLDEQKAPPREFWEEAISAVRERFPSFLFLAEAYWAMEGELQRLGFDYTYDKALYDWLRSCDGHAITPYLAHSRAYQERCVRFIENHDEPRAALVFDPAARHRCAALVVAALPGAHLFHDGELEGRRIRVPVQLRRRCPEPEDPEIRAFYSDLLRLTSSPLFRKGEWLPLAPCEAWPGNTSCRCFITILRRLGDEMVLAAVNLASHQSQCYVRIPVESLMGKQWLLKDLLGDDVYEREGSDLCDKGLYLDLAPWQYHLFSFEVLP
jgi:hypothetical protein